MYFFFNTNRKLDLVIEKLIENLEQVKKIKNLKYNKRSFMPKHSMKRKKKTQIVLVKQ